MADTEKSIAEDLANLATTERVRHQLQKRGFNATEKYTEYFGWFMKKTGVRRKAMDMFNQTVAVKDIQGLNRFIRDHMLESMPWAERIENLQTHFVQLTEAYQSLLKVKRQSDLLSPISKRGLIYREHAHTLLQATKLLEAAGAFFCTKMVVLLEPAANELLETIRKLEIENKRVDGELMRLRDAERRINNEIENAGGARLREIPLLIDRLCAERETKLERFRRVKAALEAIGMKGALNTDQSLKALQASVPDRCKSIDTITQALKGDRDQVLLRRAEAHSTVTEDRRELEALGNRVTKLPESFVEVRRQLCASLRLPETELAFAAELIAVLPEERAWEASIEMVLRPFALSLLVIQRHYSAVSAFIDKNRIRDSRGEGQRLVYLRVAERQAPRARSMTYQQSLLRKLKLRDGHTLLPWVKAELEERYDYLCCDTIEEFQSAQGLALTKERHTKARGVRHEKDDRNHALDARRFILGWDNKEKKKLLARSIQALDGELSALDEKLARLDREFGALNAQKAALEEIRVVTHYSTIDYVSTERDIYLLKEEKTQLEEADDQIQTLKGSLSVTMEKLVTLQKERDDGILASDQCAKDLRLANNQLSSAKKGLIDLERSGDLPRHQERFSEIEAFFLQEPLTHFNVIQAEQPFKDARRTDIERLRNELKPMEDQLTKLMAQYLRDFGEDRDELGSTIDYLDSFCELYERIVREDLPKHEERFKVRMNEKVIQEIGLLNGAFQTERVEIEQKIGLLNHSLQQLEYRPGTFMRLEPRAIRDPEIVGFQTSLRECLAGTFEISLAADEARYNRIAKLLERLRDDERWRERVTDVRRWFDFGAREIEAETGAERSYYEDSTGQSGGEKAKLAFTILVAAIAYQYDIDPSRPISDRFHFVVVDEMFSKVDDNYAEYALELFRKFGLQLLIVAPLDAKARVTEPYVESYLHAIKDPKSHRSEIYSMTAREFEEAILGHPVM